LKIGKNFPGDILKQKYFRSRLLGENMREKYFDLMRRMPWRDYVILGACNPPYAYRTLQTNLDVGLLLPCNVIVYETDDHKACVSVLNPVSALEVIKSEELRKIAEEVSGKLERVIGKVAKG
jgi:uncharacterized protein (DUF302 family)